MDLLKRMEEMTLKDVVPCHGMTYHVYSSDDIDIYIENDGGIFKQHTIHKTLNSIIEQNKEESNNFSRTGRLGTNVKVASMPSDIFYDLHDKGITEDSKEFNNWLNKSDNGWARTNNLNL